MPWVLIWVPVLAGIAVWTTGGSRRRLAATALPALAGTAVLAVWLTARSASVSTTFGAGLELRLALTPLSGIVAVLVPVVALAVVAFATAHEEERGLARLVGLLVVFVGAMELVVAAADLLSLLIGWELVGAASWGLIAHEWRDATRPQGAAHAFNTTRFADLGLFLAAGAAFTATGSLDYAVLGDVGGTGQHVLVGGILAAAAGKSAQVPFAPWLFSAMRGPTSVSALLHSATMVAAGAYLLARLHGVLDGVAWFGPATIAVGLTTAVAGGVVAWLQTDAKRLLAASTSAQYGLMLIAVGAGHPLVAVLHLVAHAFVKSLLFLTAGVAWHATGSLELGRMRLGRHLPRVAVVAGIGALALGAVPPLGAAWTKEGIVAAAGHVGPWLTVLVIAAGGLSALYAARYWLLAYGSADDGSPSPRELTSTPGPTEHGAMWVLAAVTVVLSALWVPSVGHAVEQTVGRELPTGKAWELAASIATVVAALYGAVVAGRRDRLAASGLTGRGRAASRWLGIGIAAEALVVDPVLATARLLARFDAAVIDGIAEGAGRLGGRAASGLARFDAAVIDGIVEGAGRLGRRAASGLARLDNVVVDRIVDGTGRLGLGTADVLARLGERGVDGAIRGLTAAIGAAGRDLRRAHTGLVHHYLAYVAGGAVVLLAAAALWR